MRGLLLIAAVFAVGLFASCNNDDDNNAVIPMPAPAGTGFTWKENDPNGSDHVAATAMFTTQYHTLIAKDAQDATVFEINLSSGAPGTYMIGSANAVTFTAVNPYFTAESGEVIITANANGKMSGTFKAFRSGTGTTRLYGTFNDITVNP